MSAVVAEYVEKLDPKAKGTIRGTAKLVITGEGSVMLDEAGAREGDGEADVVLIASDEVFRNILSGDQNPVMAFMSGKLKVEGNTQRALKVSAILTE
ncbi:SCP2 sterol-binding domain-containing protein [Roseovarius rhodophyticola]|uniref:SCP2 sterol-binding domain-containing protein n=1 Tax=Roseovarius rhodophyticola TaxID=3080827 RepID=A0ABZ2TJ39_9RHOB|nr:SCP2 sterol-binding domain-containing protein [Roseovarius sp. W115]MDV2929886.1 SCP2 sterol-binding domain-containing protein [Roseovarius sp. W115]